MDVSLSSWQWALIIIGSSAAGVGFGLLAAYLVQRSRRKPWPISSQRPIKVERFAPLAATAAPIKEVAVAAPPPQAARQKIAPKREVPAVVTAAPKSAKAKSDETIERYIRARNGSSPQIEVPEPPKSEALVEVEANLKIASSASRGKLVAFRTSVVDARQNRFISLPSEAREDLKEAYTDMRLANSLVWLSQDLGRQSSEMENSYLKLCGAIAERLERAIPGLKRSGI